MRVYGHFVCGCCGRRVPWVSAETPTIDPDTGRIVCFRCRAVERDAAKQLGGEVVAR